MNRPIEVSVLACQRQFRSLAVAFWRFVSDFGLSEPISKLVTRDHQEHRGLDFRGILCGLCVLLWRSSSFAIGSPISDLICSVPVGLILACVLGASAAAAPRTQSPSPVQETDLSPSGKFTQPGTATATNRAVAPTLADLLQALKVEPLSSNRYRIGRVEFDRLQRTVCIPAQVKNRDLVVEYALVTEQGKAYESLLVTDASPIDIHLGCLLLGAGQGTVGGAFRKPASVPETNAVQIEVSWETNSQPVHVALSALICLTGAPPQIATPTMSVERWLYNGSGFDAGGFAAQREGSIISLIRDAAALVNNPAEDRDNDALHWPNARVLPVEGWPVRVMLRLPRRSR